MSFAITIPRTSAAIILLAFFATIAGAERIPIPAPMGAGGDPVYPPDQVSGGAPPITAEQFLARVHPGADLGMPAGRTTFDGGDDVVIFGDAANAWKVQIDVASNGDIYALCYYDFSEGPYGFDVYRSTDHGNQWTRWARFYSGAGGSSWRDPVMHIAEGSEDRMFIAYTRYGDEPIVSQVWIAWSPLDLEEADFTPLLLHEEPNGVSAPSITSDATSFFDYYIYVAYSADDGDGHDIYFRRSIDQGDSYEEAYAIGTISAEDRAYWRPIVKYGFGNWIHVAWYFDYYGAASIDDAIRYRRAPYFASGGPDGWEAIQAITSGLNGVDEMWPKIGVSRISPEVVITYNRYTEDADETRFYEGLATVYSHDSGETFSAETLHGDGLPLLGDIVHQESTDRWILPMQLGSDSGYQWSTVLDPADWSDFVQMSDALTHVSGGPSIDFHPDYGHQIAIGMVGHDDDSENFLFDAEWRDAPGYPLYEDGFPMTLDFTPYSHPCLVDLNGDGDLEIVISDLDGLIHVLQPDGSPLPGWPVDPGHGLLPWAVAVGDLTGDGDLTVVAGTVDGYVYAYDADGTLADGWPWSSGMNQPAYVALGALGGPYLRAVVVGIDDQVLALDYQGNLYPGSTAQTVDDRITQKPAIGDIDGDGIREVVVGAQARVFALDLLGSGIELYAWLSDTLSAPVALGDFDLDGDVEIAAGVESGVVHLLDGDGSAFPGFWPVETESLSVSGLAIAHCLGTLEPELAVTTRAWHAYVFWEDGEVGIGWPVETGRGWWIIGEPIFATISGSPEVFLGARDGYGWSWDNFGVPNPGWPKAMDRLHWTPAYGDIDQDGNGELVFFGQERLHIVDVGMPGGHVLGDWPMSGYDPERTSCFNCPLEFSAVGEETGAPEGASIRFAAPSPNPISGSARFAYAIPTRAVVELNLYDMNGRLVASVGRAEEAAGAHAITWDGLDLAGQPVASGQYVAGLTVRAAGVNQTLTRKVAILR